MTDIDDTTDTKTQRRHLLKELSILISGPLAGCTSGRGFMGNSGATTGGCSDVPDNLSGPVPEPYRGATSQGGLSRKPSKLLSKSKANYQREPNRNQKCSKCSYYIPDKNGNCLGACVRVEGKILPNGWCEYYRAQVGGGW